MVQTNTEYMSDTARVERVVQKFMNMTLKEFKTPQTEQYIDFVVEEIIRREDLSGKRVQDMSYIEFACLIDQVGGNSLYDWKDHDSWSEQLFYFMCVAAMLVNGSKDSIPVRLFTALPLKAFYTYMGSNKCSYGSSLQSEFEHIAKCCQYNEDYTIMDFLSEKINVLNKAWKPIQSLEEYQQKMMAAHKDIGILLINSFRLAFPDRFHAEDIRDRYSDFFDFIEETDPFDDEFECEEAYDGFECEETYDEFECESEFDGFGVDNQQQWEQENRSDTESKYNNKK